MFVGKEFAYTALSVHDEVSEQIGFDDGDVDLFVQVDDIWSVETMHSIVPLHVLQGIVVRQHLVPIVWVLRPPRLRSVGVALFELKRANLPCLPYLPWNHRVPSRL
ncbi:unnamed protein product [Periconia digitata]|uniref:Uncharacterized protein n=1 Tax=Periconia digitata TaxID=1303443 RepID=A0A9W4XDG2_9PLEO|nr:unnamed protein product [Periconia digitata]